MNPKDMSFEAKFTMDEEGMRGLAKFLKELDDETLDAIFSGKQGLILHDPKRGETELSHVVRCKDCKMFKPYDGRSDGYCEVPRMTYDGDEYINVEDDNYCNYGERKEQEK